MAVVFRAIDLGLGRTVALKVLNPALAEDRAFRERFIRESRTAAAVDHPYIIPVYGAGEADGVLYLAMRYVPSGDLRELIRRGGRLTAERAVRLVSALSSALDAAHRAGLVHRDVKPANILIDASSGSADHPYLADFGLAKGAAASGLTGTGQFIGTLQYSAPEQIRGQRTVPQTDQYALACVAFTMLTGAVPFPYEEPSAVMWAHLSEPPPSVDTQRPGLPAGLDAVLARALAKAPEDRYPTCGEFAEAVRTALAAGASGAGASGAGASGAGAYPPSGLTGSGQGLGSEDAGTGAGTGTSASASAGAGLSGSSAHADTVTSLPPVSLVREHTDQVHGQDLTMDRTEDLADRAVPVRPGGTFWRSRGRPALLVTAVLAVAAGGALLGIHPWVHPPVLRPAGLGIDAATTSSLTIRWTAPATGPLPDHYEVVRNGTPIGTVPGTVTDYTDSGLAPDSAYQYQLYAVRGGIQSPVSRQLTAKTSVPPLSAARFSWSGDVSVTMKSLNPSDSAWDKQPGQRWSESWTISPDCSSGPCGATLSGNYDKYPFTAKLARSSSGTGYSGTGQQTDEAYCIKKSNGINATLTVKLTVKSAEVSNGQWVVKSFSGILISASAPKYTCTGETSRNTITGNP
jgi:serine/threonine-protein kinase